MKSLGSSLTSMIGMILAQSMIVIFLCLLCNFITLFTFSIAGYAVGGLITFSGYALIWALIWWSLYRKYGTLQFHLKLTFATIPLIVFTAWYIWLHPTPNYTLMIPLLPTDIHFWFSTAVSGTLLFPLYSILLTKYFFPRCRTWLRFLLVMSPLVLVGVISFTLCFILLPDQW